MPIIKRAIKKLAHDKKRNSQNKQVREHVRSVVKLMREKPNAKALIKTFQALDKAAKRNIIHPNKANRLKSRLSKLLKK